MGSSRTSTEKTVMGTDKKHDGGTDLLDRQDAKVEKPKMYKVVLLNDDYTPFDFVVYVLSSIFKKTIDEGVRIAMSVHNSGAGVAGVYTLDVAETKAAEAQSYAKSQQHPLQLRVEQE